MESIVSVKLHNFKDLYEEVAYWYVEREKMRYAINNERNRQELNFITEKLIRLKREIQARENYNEDRANVEIGKEMAKNGLLKWSVKNE